MDFKPFQRMRERIALDRQDSTASYYLALMYGHEFVIRLIVAGFVAGIDDDTDRTRYRIEHRLVRTSGVGDWVDALSGMIVGPESQRMGVCVKAIRKELTQRASSDDWRFEVVSRFRAALEQFPAAKEAVERLPGKVPLLQWCRDFVVLRNKTRGHGAPSQRRLESACEAAASSLSLVFENLSLFKRPWVYLRRNLSGKYRVCSFGEDAGSLAPLRSAVEQAFDDGVYIEYESPQRVSLVSTDADLSDFFVANGGFTDARYEVLSFITGETQHAPSHPYLRPADPLPASVTEGRGFLDITGNTFTNLPRLQGGYVDRHVIESDLLAQLESTRHPIITMDGRGGIGKTSTALHVVTQLMHRESPPFEIVIWFSSRDIDLETDRPKQVRPAGISIDDFAVHYAMLLDLPGQGTKGFNAREAFAAALGAASGQPPTLFVFDNFETVASPGDAFAWIDTYVRNPNKVLITTRIRGNFKADYPIHVQGMEEAECRTLITQTAARLGVSDHLDESFVHSIIDESEGHPYVVKVLLGELARRPNVRKVERVIASREDILEALFERTYEMLSPAGRRVFLTLCNWRSVVPELAVEAVVIRPGNERLDVRRAIEELVNSSLVDELASTDGEYFLSVPLAAQVFGRRKLENDPYRGSIVEDSRLLQQFGAAQKHEVERGVEARLQILFHNIRTMLDEGATTLEACRPVIEYVARKYPKAWLFLSDLCEGTSNESSDNAATYLRRYLEREGTKDSYAWKRLADIHRAAGRGQEEVNALVQLSKVPTVPLHAMSNAVNRINNLLRVDRVKFEGADLDRLLREVAAVFRARSDECTATDLSRLAWLYLSVRDVEVARQLVDLGLQREADNPHCQNLRVRLENWVD